MTNAEFENRFSQLTKEQQEAIIKKLNELISRETH